MKKVLALFFALFFVIPCCACNTKREIKSVTIENKTYNSIYLYSFSNADIDYDYSILFDSPVNYPTSNGYVLSKNKVSETVDVWNQFIFNRNTNSQNTKVYSNSYEISADVVEMLEEYPIDIEEKTDTYIITYYTYGYSTDIDKERLLEQSLKKHVVEMVKSNVVVTYYE